MWYTIFRNHRIIGKKEMFVGPGMNWNVLDMAYEYKKVAC